MNETSHLVDDKYAIGDLVDLNELRRIFERFTAATGFTIGFLDHPGLNVLIGAGWRDLCTKFHRSCPLAADNCTRSNRHLLDSLDEPGKLLVEECENGLVDCAFPIIIKGKHIASLATGQLLLAPPDRERFRRQAKLFGFDEAQYLKALDEIPVIPEARLRSVTTFLGEMALMLSEVGYARLTSKEAAARLENEMTVRRQVEDALRESEEHYRRLFNLESDAIVVIDVETLAHVDVNTTVETMYGYTREELLRMKATDLSAEPEQTGARIRQADGYAHIPLRWHRKKDGTVFPVDITARFFVSKGRNMLITAMRDISDRVHAEEERVRLHSQLAQSQKMELVGRLAGGVAHDFNNMLGVILGCAEMAIDQIEPTHPIRADLEEIRKAADRSVNLTRQLLAFACKQTIAPKVLNLNETVAGTLRMLQRLMGENIRVEWHPAADLWPVEMDPSQVDQILTNLCVNARDAIAGVGTITIETANDTFDAGYCASHAGFLPGDFVRLTISDTGCGMDQETQNHIFEPFFTTKGVGSGTGLGLATVYGAIEQNHGFITVRSQPGHGATFTIHLPRYAGVSELARPGDTGPSRRRGHEVILLVEDEPAFLQLIRTALERQGYTVLAAHTPTEALRLARAQPNGIDLLVTDIVMPEMNGRELASTLKPMVPNLRHLFMSGYPANVIDHNGVLYDDVDFIQKPFSMKDLAAKVRDVLDTQPSEPTDR